MPGSAASGAPQDRVRSGTGSMPGGAAAPRDGRGALSRLLIDFDALAPARPGARAGSATYGGLALQDAAGAVATPSAAEQDADVLASRIADAVAGALAEAEARHVAQREALEAGYAEALAAERAGWAEREGRALETALKQACSLCEDRLAEAAAAVLAPFVADAARGQAIAALRAAIASLEIGGSGAAILISGPEDLLGGLRAALEGAGRDTGNMTFTASETSEVTILSDSSTVRTRLGDWSRTLQARLGDDHE